MGKSNNHIGLQIFIQLFFPILMGIILLGPSVIMPSNSFFVFSLYGFSAVMFYYIIINHGIRKLLLLGPLLSIILLAVFKPSTDIPVFIRNFSWYFLIGLLVICINKMAKDRPRLFIIAAWFVGFTLVYIIMVFLNVYIFQLYKITKNISLSFYILQGIKIGGILGLGIGIGKIAADSLIQNDIKASRLKT